eukprot:GHVQ01012526.1.p1 GENE.GHVQ01012526.1~~GHVQ01012526.1.p1  ORF type:complete len:113 (+),score=12.66 GHVQ01012526.1:842-1180(+)
MVLQFSRAITTWPIPWKNADETTRKCINPAHSGSSSNDWWASMIHTVHSKVASHTHVNKHVAGVRIHNGVAGVGNRNGTNQHTLQGEAASSIDMQHETTKIAKDNSSHTGNE